MMLYKSTNAMIPSSDENTNFHIIAGVMQGDILAL